MNKKILLIEDQNNFHDILKKDLENRKYDVVVAPDNSKAMKLLEQFEPDLIVLNALQKKVADFFLFNEIKIKSRLSSAPVMIISVSGRSAEIENILFMGAEACILKNDFNSMEVIERVEQIIANNYLKSDSNNKADSGNSEKKHSIDNKIKILLVEDDEFLRDICKRKLEKEGFVVSVAVDGNEAMEKIMREEFQLILLDVVLPVIDGFEILKRTKADPKKSSIPIVMLTNLGQTSDIEKGFSLGADDYIVKAHYTVGEIVEKIKEILERNKLI